MPHRHIIKKWYYQFLLWLEFLLLSITVWLIFGKSSASSGSTWSIDLLTILSLCSSLPEEGSEQMFTIRGGLRLYGAPGWILTRGPFYIYKTVVNKEKINERTEVFVLLKQKKLEQKKTNRQLIWRHNMNETHWFQVSISCWRLETLWINVHKTPVECFKYTAAPRGRPPGNAVFPMLMHYLCFTNTTTPGIQAAATVQLLQNW